MQSYEAKAGVIVILFVLISLDEDRPLNGKKKISKK